MIKPIKPKPNNTLTRKILGAVFILPVLISGCGGGEQASQTSQAIPVKLEELESDILIESSQYVGTLEATKRVNLAPRIEGRILKIFVDQGDRVLKGQPIMELEPTQEQENVNAARQSVNVEKAGLVQAEAELKTAEAEQARSAADVKTAEANVLDSEAEVKLSKINIERSKFLVEGGVRPEQDLDDKTRDLNTDKAQLEADKESLNASIKALEAAKKRVLQAQANIESQKASILRAEAELGSVTQPLEFNTLKAPINGVVGSLSEKKIGDVVRLGEQVTTLTNNRLFNLNIGIPTEEKYRLKIGLPVEIVNQDGSAGTRGYVSFVSPLVDQSSQSILTKITFPNDDSLRDRQYVRVRVIWETKPGLLVPTIAVSTLGGQRFVFVAKQGETPEGEPGLIAQQTPIQVGSIQEQSFQVISGLKEGDRIAVNRILDLKDGTSISEESIKSEQPNSK